MPKRKSSPPKVFKIPSPCTAFRVRLEGPKSLFYDVFVWDSFKTLRTLGRVCRLRHYRRAAAFTLSYIGTNSKKLGEIHFCHKDLSAEVVNHESTHAALALGKHYDLLNAVNENSTGPAPWAEERICYAQGRLSQNIATKLWKEGFYTRFTKELSDE